VSTTSSDDKAETLKKLGADHVLNYRQDKEWGKTAKDLTGGLGFKHVIEVGGTATLRQSLNAVAIEGVISIIGFLGEGEEAPSFLEALNNTCIVRGIWIGSRQQLEEVSRAIDANRIEPVIDDRVFKFDELKEAYQYMEAQKHFGKVCISFE
jgi:NADPH:quinone reductase-like Zn-dependent oxidoreductase